MNSKVLVLSLVFCMLFSGLALGQDAGKRVVVTGLGENTPRGRKDAVQDAQRKAIEKAVGTYVSAEMQVQNREVIEEKIYTRNNAYLKSSTVLSQGVNRDGLWEVKLEAFVAEGKIKDDIQAFNIIKAKKGNPRLMVIVKVTDRKRHYYSNPDTNGIRAKIERRLLRKKFKLVDIDQVRNIQQIEEAAASGDASRLKALASRYGAEVIVTCNATKVFVRSFEKWGMKTDIFNLDIALKAVVADTAEMIYSDSAQEAQTGYFDDLHRHATNLTKDMIEAIQEKWQDDVFNSSTYILEVQKATYIDVLTLQEALGYELGVESVFERAFEDNVAILEVQFAGTSGQFGVTLADLPEPQIKVLGRSANKFRVVMVKGAPQPAGDTEPPVVTITSPANGASVGKAMQTLTVTGTVDDAEVTAVDIMGRTFPVADGSFAGTVELMNGQNLIEVAAEDASGNVGVAEITVVLDNKPPKILFKVLDFEAKTFEGNVDDPQATLTVNGRVIPLDRNGDFKIVLESVEDGELVFKVTDRAGNTKERIYDY